MMKTQAIDARVLLYQAEDLLKRGVKMLNRPEWEPGETENEWRSAVSTYLGMRKAQREQARVAVVKR